MIEDEEEDKEMEKFNLPIPKIQIPILNQEKP